MLQSRPVQKLIILLMVGASLSAPAHVLARMSTSTPCLGTNSCVVGYLADWGMPLATLAASTYLKNLDFVHYAFAIPNPDGTITPPFNAASNPAGFAAALAAARTQNPGLKIVISVGGAGSANTAAFESIAASADLRSMFANAIASLVASGGFDGVDIDWELGQQRGSDPGEHAVHQIGSREAPRGDPSVPGLAPAMTPTSAPEV